MPSGAGPVPTVLDPEAERAASPPPSSRESRSSEAHAPSVQQILDAPVAGVLRRLAAPNVFAVAMMTAVTFADAWFVGQLGAEALASLALAFLFLTLMVMMAGGSIGGGTTSAVARAMGAGDTGRAESIAWHAALLALAMSGLFMIVLGLFARPIFQLLGGEGAALDGAADHARIAFGVGAALTAAVGVNVGAGRYARARRIAWTGAGATFVLTGLVGVCVAAMPDLWLDLFTADPGARDFGVRYLVIAAPFHGLFGAGQALYFASQGTGRLVLPVTVSVVRFLTVAVLGALAVSFGWGVTGLFIVVAVGLTLMGVGQALCLLGPGWRANRTPPVRAGRA